MLPQQRNRWTDCKSAQQCTTRGQPLPRRQVTSGSVQQCGRTAADRQTDRQTDTHTHRQTLVTTIHVVSSTTHAKCNQYRIIADMGPAVYGTYTQRNKSVVCVYRRGVQRISRSTPSCCQRMTSIATLVTGDGCVLLSALITASTMETVVFNSSKPLLRLNVLYMLFVHHNRLRPFSGTTRVSRCHKRTSGLYGARDD